MAKVVSLENFSAELKDFTKVSVSNYKKAVVDALLKSIPRLVKNSPIDTGLYAQSWDVNLTEESAILGNFAPHAGVIEHGARPFTPPIGPLVSWAKRVLKNQTLKEGQTLDQAAWALAKYTQIKISEHGMKPRHILANELNTIMADIKENLKKDLK